MSKSEAVPSFDILRRLDSNGKVALVSDDAMHPAIMDPYGGIDPRVTKETPGILWLQRIAGHFERAAFINPKPPKSWGRWQTTRVVRRFFTMFLLTVDGVTRRHSGAAGGACLTARRARRPISPVRNWEEPNVPLDPAVVAPHGSELRRCGPRTWQLVVALLAATSPLPARAQTLPRKDLAQCIEIALQQHPDLKAAAATVDVGRARTWEAISIALPQVNGDYNASRRHSSVSARTNGPGGPTGQISNRAQTFNFYSTGFTLSQILFDFGQSLNAIRAARATERSLEANASTTRESVIFDVKQSYFTLLTAKRLLGVADENVAQDQKHVDLAQGRSDVGVATRFDITQAQVQLANAELSQVTARNNVAVAAETLRNSLGLVGPLDFDIVDTLDIHDVRLDEPKALALAYDHRPELLSQRFQEESVSEQVAALQKNYLPNVTGDASYIWSGSEYPLQPSWNISAAVNVPLFNGGGTTAQIAEARANLANLRYQEQSLRQQIALQVRQAVLNLRLAHESIRVSEKGLYQARENVDLAEGRYKTGIGNIIELTDAQAALTVAEGSNVQALSNYKTAVAALEQATAQSLGEDTSEPGPAPTP